MTLLEVESLSVNYGHIEAIRDISFSVEEGTITTLIGANGAGKTTTLKTISGLRPVRAGRIVFDGKDITNSKPYERVKMGLTQSPEGRRVFPGMTVRENLVVAATATQHPAPLRLPGLDPDRSYRLSEELPPSGGADLSGGWSASGTVLGGRVLATAGVALPVLDPEEVRVLHVGA